MQNPYTNRGMIRDPSIFFGRIEDLTRIYTMLADTQSVSILGDRRIGKSSLLYCLALPIVQARIPEFDFSDYIFVHIDLQGSTHKSPEEFFGYLLNKLGAKKLLRLKISTKVSRDVFEETIAKINAMGLKIVLLLDEFDSVARNEQFDLTFFSFLRFMATNYNLSLITASQRRLADLGRSSITDSHFFNIFGVVVLSTLKLDEALELITMPSVRAGHSLANEADWVLQLAGTHPLFVQMACFYLFEAKVHLQREVKVDYETIMKLFFAEAQDHFNYALAHLSNVDRQILQEEIWKPQGPYRHYLAASAEFRRFAREQSEWPESKVHFITKEAVEDALEHLWDLVSLGQSQLTNLNIVRTRLLQNSLNASGSDTGKVIREVLIESMQHLKVEERDEKMDDKKWRYWSILQRRYVEKKQNVEIVARLNISNRTFYRERNEAIEALVTILHDMELSHP